LPATRTTTIAALALLALTGGCGGTSAGKPLRAATFGLASPTPASSDRPTPPASPTLAAVPGSLGAWTSRVDLPVPVTDGTVVAGVTRNNDRVQAVDATTGRPLWDVPVPLAAGATPGGALGTTGPVLLAAPGAPLVVGLTATTPGSSLTPGSTGPAATALDPGTGRVVWTAPGPANLLDGAAVLTGTAGVDTAGSTTTALDPATGRARWTRPGEAVYEKVPGGATTGPYGLDMRTGRVLWQLTPAQSAKTERVGGGLAWVDGADGYVALDDRTGRPRAQGLADYPLLALSGEQVKAGDTGLVATSLPG